MFFCIRTLDTPKQGVQKPSELAQCPPQDLEELQSVTHPSQAIDDTHIFPEMKFDPETKR